MVGPLERLAHVEAVLPEICSLDCGTLNFGDSVYVSTPAYLRVMAERIQALGVKPELECFDTGHVRFARALIDEGLVGPPPLFQICLGIPWGAPAGTAAMKNMVDMLPEGAVWAGFGISAMEMPMAAQAVLLGGFSIITVASNSLLLEIGPTMPAILLPEAEKIWMDPTSTISQLLDLLLPYPDSKMNFHPVSHLVDSLGENSEKLIQQTEPMDQYGNYSLFD